ncbi:N-acetylmuramoyl-L-alanine amidase family protein [Sphingomonas glaciei]|uniref:N-acetylmuramoyl-L-alanine amidase n=1 Tax=Sphingomonas glaciei TaxID=2938948 RepID=A0ABY5MTK8_9SPHN|nr:N-acetylmuramoyl-L-alanine amidase [Sphingomonas glaciei]UUR07767.1 N-acetylmuramoyl-L-alanine amidase [Sphingomonas glaciei]
MRRRSPLLPVLLLAAVGVAGLVAAFAFAGERKGQGLGLAVAGEARQGGLSLALAPAVADVRITEARTPGRPLVVIDPGHGGRDGGAPGASGATREKDVTLLIARELRDELASRGRVRIALTRDGDIALDLDDRAAIARRLGANLFLAIHADSAPNPGARGATAYSLSEVASDEDAAALAARQNGEGAVASAPDASLRALLSDLAARDEMDGSADFALRILRESKGRVLLRPEPHRFAAFRVLRRSGAPAVLFEAGYMSNAEDEAMLLDPVQRGRIVTSLARAIEAQAAAVR